MTLSATNAQRQAITNKLQNQLGAIETDCYEITSEDGLGSRTDNACDLYDLECQFLIDANAFQAKIAAYRFERARIAAYIAAETERLEAMPYTDPNDEHRTYRTPL